MRDALWRTSIGLAELFGADRAAMRLTVEIGVAAPQAVDRAAVAAIFPYGEPRIDVRRGGLDVPRPDASPTVIAVAAIHVALDGMSAEGSTP